MRILIMGAGGVGGYFGARLAHAGCEVGFVARGAHLRALQTDGLRLQSALGDLVLPTVEASDDPADLPSPDLVILGVKLWDTAAAIEQLRPILAPHTAVVSFQNGVVKDDWLREGLGPRSVIGGACYIAASILAPGTIQHAGTMQKLVFGEYDGTRSGRIDRFREACVAAGIDAELSSDIRRTLWEKFVFLVGLSGTTALARCPIGPIRAQQRARAFLRDAMDEVVQVARAEGVAVPPDYARDRLDFVDSLPATMSSSMHGDLMRGNRLEVKWLSGDVVQRGRRLGVATPCNRAIADILALYASGPIA